MTSPAPHATYSEWIDLERSFLEAIDTEGRDARDIAFRRSRLTEGRRVGEFFMSRFPKRPLRVLDIGTGNAGVAVGIGNLVGYEVVALDVAFNRGPLALRSSAPPSVRFVLGDGQSLPFTSASFDIALCLETIEHVDRPTRLGSEIMRVLRPGGVSMVTTPPRVTHLFRPDPHYGIPGLVILPDSLQRWVATKLLKRVSPREYNVDHIYWYAGSIARFFPGHSAVQAVDSASKSAFLSRFAWKRLLIWKAG